MKRLTSIYEAITRATTRNSDFINEVSRALKEGAVAVKQPRPQTPPRKWSKRAQFRSSAEEDQPTKPMTSPAPAPSVRSPKLRSESSKSSASASERPGRCGPSLLRPTPESACAISSEKPRSPLRCAPNATVLPPTPPESPVEELDGYDFTPGSTSEAQSTPQFVNPTSAAEPLRAEEVARPPFPRIRSAFPVGLPSHISSLGGLATNRAWSRLPKDQEQRLLRSRLHSKWFELSPKHEFQSPESGYEMWTIRVHRLGRSLFHPRSQLSPSSPCQ